MSKAFDCININFALDKLDALDVRGNLLKWIETYMKDRTIAVKLKQTISECATMNHGVPQGSVLGPFIFTFFINDLPLHISGDVTLYADDAVVIINASNEGELHTKICEVIEQFETWCNKNSLKLNTSKTTLIRFCTRQRFHKPLVVDYKGMNLQALPVTKYLGTYIDSDMSWRSHTDNVSKEISKKIFLLLSLKQTVDKEHLLQVYFSLIQSSLAFNIILWGASTDLSRVFVVQKRAIRIIFDLAPLQTCRDAFVQSRIMTLPALYIYHCIKYVRNHVVTTRVGSDHTYDTRCGDLIRVERHNTSTFEKSPVHKGIYFFNILPDHIRLAPQHKFLTQVKNHLIECCPYSIREFITVHG